MLWVGTLPLLHSPAFSFPVLSFMTVFLAGRKKETPLLRLIQPPPSLPTTFPRLIYSNSTPTDCLLLVFQEEYGCVEDTRPGNDRQHSFTASRSLLCISKTLLSACFCIRYIDFRNSLTSLINDFIVS